MKKKHWIILIIAFICVDLIVFYALYPSSPAQNIPSVSAGQEGENETQIPGEFTFPGFSEEPSEGSGGEGGSGEGGTGGSGEGGEEPTGPTGPVNYTLYIKSDPSNLSVFVNYSIDGIILNATEAAPYSLKVDGDSFACVLASELKGSGTLKWTKDNEDCMSSLCYPPYYGCEVLMDSNHIVTEHWNASGTG